MVLNIKNQHNLSQHKKKENSA